MTFRSISSAVSRAAARGRSAPPAVVPADFSVSTARMSYELGVSIRQLQTWDELKLVTPVMYGHARHYGPQQIVEVAAVAAFRAKGVSLKAIRPVLAAIKKCLDYEVLIEGYDVYIAVDRGGRNVIVSCEIGEIGRAAVDAAGPVMAVKIGPEVRLLFAGVKKDWVQR